jgi:hypothetical protein
MEQLPEYQENEHVGDGYEEEEEHDIKPQREMEDILIDDASGNDSDGNSDGNSEDDSEDLDYVPERDVASQLLELCGGDLAKAARVLVETHHLINQGSLV